MMQIQRDRSQAASALGHVHKQLAVVLPALLKSLKDPESFVRLGAANALGLLGPDAESASRHFWRSGATTPTALMPRLLPTPSRKLTRKPPPRLG